MSWNDIHKWWWYRCPITGCGAGPLRVRPHPHEPGSWSVGYTAGPLWVFTGPEPLCPRCGHDLEALATSRPTVFAGALP